MGIFRRAISAAASWPQLSPDDERVWSSWAPKTRAGVPMDASRALMSSPVWSALRLITGSVSMLPLHMYRHRNDGGKDAAREHPLEVVLARRPNRHMTTKQFRSMMQMQVELRGNAYAEILPGDLGFVDQLMPLHPDRVSIDQEDNGDVIYKIRDRNGEERVLLEEEVFHLKGMSTNGIRGLDTVDYARESLGHTAAIDEYGSRLFGQGTQVRGLLKHPRELSPEAAARISRDFNDATAGAGNSHVTRVIEEGMDWVQIGLTNEDAQFLESRTFQVGEVARWFNVPRHMIGDLERATFSNIEHQQLEFVMFSLMPRLVEWEQAISRYLILRDDIYYAEHTVDALLRGDTTARYTAYKMAIDSAIMNANEARAKENMNPYDGGEIYFRQLNMAPVGSMAEESDQFAKTVAGYLTIWSEQMNQSTNAHERNGHARV